MVLFGRPPRARGGTGRRAAPAGRCESIGLDAAVGLRNAGDADEADLFESASEAFTRAATRSLYRPTFTFSMAPSRVLSISMAPSAFSIWPRMRAGCCAAATRRQAQQRPATPSVRRNRHIHFMHCVLHCGRHLAPDPSADNPSRLLIPADVIGWRFFSRQFCAEIGFDQGAQFRRHFRRLPNPAQSRAPPDAAACRARRRCAGRAPCGRQQAASPAAHRRDRRQRVTPDSADRSRAPAAQASRASWY